MKKILKIETIINKCLDCHDKIWVVSVKGYCCGKKSLRDIKDVMTIPEWCPLEDYKEIIK